MSKSKVLVVIPTLGERLDLLRETLQSLTTQASLRPDIVVVCPAKNKAARALAEQFGAEIVDDPKEPRGISAAVNAGFAESKPWHEYGAWMGDDDLLRPNTLHHTASLLDLHPKAVVAFGYCDYIDSNGKRIFTSKAGRLAPWIMTWGPNLVPLPGALFRLSAVKKVGVYDPTLKYAMDLDMLLRLRKVGSFINTGQVVGAFRWHPDSTTVAGRKASLAEAKLIKRRYLSLPLRFVAPLWEIPVDIATSLAAKKVTARAKEIQ